MLPTISLPQDPPTGQELVSELYQQYDRLMFSTAGKYTDNIHEAEEIVQDALVKLVEHADALLKVERCVLPAMVVIIVRNTAINHVKHLSVVQRHRVDMPEDGDAVCDGPSLDELMVREEQLAALRRVWELLSPDDQTLLTGKYILGMEDQELAALVGCKPGSVRMKLTRARRRALREMKKEREFDDES